jgi:phosphoribosylanthranilate isomerase
MIPDQAVAIARQGVSAIGCICVPSSPRYVTPLQIRAISQALMAASCSEVERIGVFANASMESLAVAVETGLLTALQLHGQETPADCVRVRQAYPHLKLIKALRVRSEADLLAVQPFEDVIDVILLDAYHPDLLGGTGKTLDWRSLQTFQPSKPWILAGGLTPANLQAALDLLTPDGIDLSSGVELSPGNKCLQQTQRLFDVLSGTVAAPAKSAVSDL